MHAGLAVVVSSPSRESTRGGSFVSPFFGFAVVVGLGVVVVVVMIGHPEFFS